MSSKVKKRIKKAGLPAAATLTLTALAAIAPAHPVEPPANAPGEQKEQPAGGQKARATDKLRAQIREKVDKIVISEFGVERKRVQPDARFCKDFGGHSINLIEFFVQLEDAFNLEIPDEDAQNMHYLREIYAYVEKRIGVRNQRS